MAETKKIRLTRDIILGGEHCDEGSVHEVGRALAHRLIGEGSAIHHLEEGEEPEPPATAVNRMEEATNADPAPRQVRPAPPKRKAKE
jgi:hypothetical protein